MAAVSTTHTVTLLENCRVSPPPAAAPETFLPLTFFDIIWLTFSPLSRVMFYDFPYSTAFFFQNVVPNLKDSLSLTLKHFFPLAGNLISPSNLFTSKPQIRYSDGDSVSLTFAECTSNDYNHLSGNHARDADELLPLVPQLPSGEPEEGGVLVSPLLAIQVTIFPNHGISFGFTSSHVVADGSSMFNFIRAWASAAKEDATATRLFELAFRDRSVIKDPKGIATIYCKIMQQVRNNFPPPQIHPPASTKNLRATFTMSKANIQDLKKLVSTQRPTLAYVSSLTVVCGYLWTCLAKTRDAVGKVVHEADEEEHFAVSIDCRSRLDPPIPSTYFGNCLIPRVVTGQSKRLVGEEEGFVTAAELLGEAIHTKLQNDEGGVLKDAENLFSEFAGIMKGEWGIGVAGSPKLDYYNTIDFGFGNPKKFEFVSEPLSLSRCKEGSEGDLEIGLILPNNEMDVFSTIFASGLTN